MGPWSRDAQTSAPEIPIQCLGGTYRPVRDVLNSAYGGGAAHLGLAYSAMVCPDAIWLRLFPIMCTH